MTEAQAAVGMDRLPWLTDEPVTLPRRERKARPAARAHSEINTREFAGWAVAALLLVAGGSYWLGMQSSAPSTQAIERPAQVAPEATVQLPAPREIGPSLPIAQAPELESAPAPAAAVDPPKVEGTSPRQRRTAGRPKLSPMDRGKPELSKTVATQERSQPKSASAAPVITSAPRAKPLASRSELRLWPARQTKGAYGRVVRIGAFGSRQQAKLGWRRMTRAYPAVGRLPAVVVEARNSRGRLFYRFQIGTTSQAHSEVLCQRMQRIRFSCAVIGLPWKPQGVER